MGFVFNRRQQRDIGKPWGIPASAYIPRRSIPSPGTPTLSADQAMSHSAVWAAIRIRADLLSTMPIDGYRYMNVGGGQKIQVEIGLTPMMSDPAFMEWRYSSQVELDRSGNSIGIITDTYANGLPAAIDLQPTSACVVRADGAHIIEYRINGVKYDPSVIWHEKQYTVSGCPVGLSPVAFAAFELGKWKSIQDFAAQWFTSGQGPRASLRNTEKKLSSKDIALAEETWRASQSLGTPFVHGSDWEYNLLQAQQASTDWLEAVRLSNVDIARFFNVPSDVIDAAVQGGPSITYANIVQKNLQFLIMHLGPAIQRRENSLNQLLPKPRFIKFNTDALLRMDPMSRAQMIRTQIDSRTLAPSEARALDNREPFTPEQIKEFELLGLNKTATGALAGAEDLPVPAGTQTQPASPADPNAAPQDTQGKSNG